MTIGRKNWRVLTKCWITNRRKTCKNQKNLQKTKRNAFTLEEEKAIINSGINKWRCALKRARIGNQVRILSRPCYREGGACLQDATGSFHATGSFREGGGGDDTKAGRPADIHRYNLTGRELYWFLF